MATLLKPRIQAILAFLALVGLLTAGVWWGVYVSALDPLKRRGEADLSLAADRLVTELQRFRELSVVLADHPDIAPAIQAGRADPTLVATLGEMADQTGLLDITVVDRAGRELASAGTPGAQVWQGEPAFERAMDGAAGASHGLGPTAYGRPGAGRIFVFAAPVFDPGGPAIGAVIVSADADLVESAWRGDRPTIFFTDADGIIFVASRSELVFRRRDAPFVPHSALFVRGIETWRLDGGRYLPERAIHLQRDLPVIDMTAEALIDVAPARAMATWQAGFAAALCLAFGAVIWLVTERRRTLALANQQLEGAVARRTAELSRLNADLRREVAERAAAEAQLKKAQADLVQAGKLSALGQMSAGISHELNQPLMAIRSYAENAEAFLDRGKPEVAAQNLGRIAELARRMGRIIRNLRAFAKQESEALTDVDLAAVIDGVLEMVEARAKGAGVAIGWARPAQPVIVRGGEVRMSQVVLNLVTNAMDAMEGQAGDMRIDIDVVQAGGRVELTVRDTGPGLDDPDKIFDPFYSTKSVEKDGMGLGLSISYGLVQSFGGMIRGRNHPGGGAVFTVELEAAPAREDAA